ncbi:hypothetical protein [Haloparvum sp. PAK95]|uniref:hypothetical protein n=1 Tax=Haloparvum sp. PAK95 TaxID=3418962 RepID=UPI003D2F29EA
MATLLNVPGPEIQTALLDEPVELPTGEQHRLVVGDTVDDEVIGLSTSPSAVSPGDEVLLDDGRIELTVDRVEGDEVVATIDSGGQLGGQRVAEEDHGVAGAGDNGRADLQVAAERARGEWFDESSVPSFSRLPVEKSTHGPCYSPAIRSTSFRQRSPSP